MTIWDRGCPWSVLIASAGRKSAFSINSGADGLNVLIRFLIMISLTMPKVSPSHMGFIILLEMKVLCVLGPDVTHPTLP